MNFILKTIQKIFSSKQPTKEVISATTDLTQKSRTTDSGSLKKAQDGQETTKSTQTNMRSNTNQTEKTKTTDPTSPPIKEKFLKADSLIWEQTAKELGVEVAALKAVAEVESKGSGFLQDGNCKILYEPFVFGSLTNGKFNGNLYLNSYPLSLTGKWNKTLCKYGPENIQWGKLKEALKLNKSAAYQSCSWGKFQIMGFNYKLTRFKTIEEFVAAMQESEENHFLAFADFIKSRKLIDELQQKNWASFALQYNGPSYAQNRYDEALKQAYQKFKKA